MSLILCFAPENKRILRDMDSPLALLQNRAGFRAIIPISFSLSSLSLSLSLSLSIYLSPFSLLKIFPHKNSTRSLKRRRGLIRRCNVDLHIAVYENI